MARETDITDIDGLTLYQTLRRKNDGSYFNFSTPAFETYNAAHWTNYVQALSKTVLASGVSANYHADFPTTIPAGDYVADVYAQVGGSPSVTADAPPDYTNDLSWTGTAVSTGTPGVPSIVSITFTFPVTSSVTGPIDADSLPLLTDAGGTYGVRRTDTGEVIVAALGGTIDHPATGEYAYTLNNAIPGVPYQASAKFIIDGVPIYVTDAVTAGGGAGTVTTQSNPGAAAGVVPGSITGNLLVIGGDAAPKSNVVISFSLWSLPGVDTGHGAMGDPFTYVSDGSGSVRASLYPGASYFYWGGDARKGSFIAPTNGSSFTIPSIRISGVV